LEDSKNRRSSGGHGNQHVRLRGSQIDVCDSLALRRRWTVRGACDARGQTTQPPPDRPRSPTTRNRYPRNWIIIR
jgi:hypothetical protein